MSDTIKFRILAASKIVFDGEVTMVVMPGEEGNHGGNTYLTPKHRAR